jgi:hypothetical protein
LLSLAYGNQANTKGKTMFYYDDILEISNFITRYACENAVDGEVKIDIDVITENTCIGFEDILDCRDEIMDAMYERDEIVSVEYSTYYDVFDISCKPELFTGREFRKCVLIEVCERDIEMHKYDYVEDAKEYLRSRYDGLLNDNMPEDAHYISDDGMYANVYDYEHDGESYCWQIEIL